jgi:hypothetical protein
MDEGDAEPKRTTEPLARVNDDGVGDADCVRDVEVSTAGGCTPLVP